VWKFLQEERAEVLLLEDEVVEEEIENSEAVVTVNSEAVVQEIPAEETGNSEVAENASPEVVDPEVLVEIANLEAAEIASPQHQMILQKNEDRI
jgi:hypothetical protein